MPPRNRSAPHSPPQHGAARPRPAIIQTLQGWSSAPAPLRYSSSSKTSRIWPSQVCPSAAGTAHATHKPHTTHPEALVKSPQASVAGAAGAAAGCGQDRRESASSQGGQRGRKKGEKQKAVVADSFLSSRQHLHLPNTNDHAALCCAQMVKDQAGGVRIRAAGLRPHRLFSFHTVRGLCKASASQNSQSKEQL